MDVITSVLVTSILCTLVVPQQLQLCNIIVVTLEFILPLHNHPHSFRRKKATDQPTNEPTKCPSQPP